MHDDDFDRYAHEMSRAWDLLVADLDAAASDEDLNDHPDAPWN